MDDCDDKQKVWVVVSIADDMSVAVVPNIWIKKTPNGCVTCYWPPRTKNASALVKMRREPVDESWSIYDVKILGSFGKYIEGVNNNC